MKRWYLTVVLVVVLGLTQLGEAGARKFVGKWQGKAQAEDLLTLLLELDLQAGGPGGLHGTMKLQRIDLEFLQGLFRLLINTEKLREDSELDTVRVNVELQGRIRIREVRGDEIWFVVPLGEDSDPLLFHLVHRGNTLEGTMTGEDDDEEEIPVTFRRDPAY